MINRRLGLPFGWLLVLMTSDRHQVTHFSYFFKSFFTQLIQINFLRLQTAF
ncbi:hypothetical protein CF149_14967 [Pseudomonas psychrophila]|nr:hypothetical protein CF149_14967 [Pseudomonas psychrophila]